MVRAAAHARAEVNFPHVRPQPPAPPRAGQPQVLYRALYGEGGLWVRPYAMFVEQVPGEHGPQPRFARIDD